MLRQYTDVEAKDLGKLPNLRNLRIIWSVDLIVKLLLESLELETLDVHCLLPPSQEDRILILNDDSLVEIFSNLDLRDWIALG